MLAGEKQKVHSAEWYGRKSTIHISEHRKIWAKPNIWELFASLVCQSNEPIAK
jgi:hypothetical protein